MSSQGTQSVGGPSDEPSISRDGSLVTFKSLATNLQGVTLKNWSNVYVKDVANNTITRVTVGLDGQPLLLYGGGSWPSISANGRFVAYEATASNLVPNDTNNAPDVFETGPFA